jgi:Tfp pilus assembly protein PilF
MRTRPIILSFLMLYACMVTVSAQTVDTGKKLMYMEQWNNANKTFLTLLKKNESDGLLNFYAGETYYQLGKIDSAEYYFLGGETFDPKQPLNFAGIAKITLHRGDMLKAKDQLDKAYKMDKKNMELLSYLAEACVAEKHPELAEPYIAKGKDVNPKFAGIHIAEAKYWQLKNESGKAADSYDRALIADKTCTYANLKLALIYYAGQNEDAAVENLKKAIAIDSLYAPAYKELGEVYYWSKTVENKYEEASKVYKKYMELGEISREDNYRMAYVLFYNKEYKEASAMVEKLIADDPKNPILLRIKGYVSYALAVDEKQNVVNMDYITKGLEYMNSFFAVKGSKDVMASDYEYIAKLQSKCDCGKDSLAAVNYVQAHNLDSTSTSKYRYLEEAAKLFKKISKPVQAATVYEMIIKERPDEALSYMQVGLIYYKMAVLDTAKADSLIRKTIAIKADSAFKKVTIINPQLSFGYQYRAYIASLLDPNNEKDITKLSYEQTIQIILANAPDRKKDLLPNYRFLISYYYNKAFDAKTKKSPEYQDLKTNSINYCNKVLEIVPTDAFATSIIKEFEKLDKPAPRPAAKKE